MSNTSALMHAMLTAFVKPKTLQAVQRGKCRAKPWHHSNASCHDSCSVANSILAEIDPWAASRQAFGQRAAEM